MGWPPVGPCAPSLCGICWSSLFTDISNNVAGFTWICFKDQMPLDLFIPYFKDSFSAYYDRWFAVGLLCEGFWHFACLFSSVLMVFELLWALLDLLELLLWVFSSGRGWATEILFWATSEKRTNGREDEEHQRSEVPSSDMQDGACKAVAPSVCGQVGRGLWMWGCGAVSCNVI